jgi:diguanylate cyclase (GGDEF)-like protein
LDSSLPARDPDTRRDLPSGKAQPARGFWGTLKAAVGLVADKGPAGRMLRIVLPAALLIVGLSAPALYAAHRLGFVGTAIGVALFGVINLTVVVAAALRGAWLLQGEHAAGRQLRDEILNQSLHDTLTGLANRDFFMDQLARRAALADRRTSTPFAVCSLELAGVDRINEQMGQEAGNRILVAAADVIRDCVRASDMVARLDGNKFGILLQEIADAKDIDILAQRIVSSVPPALAGLTDGAPITVSIGVILKTSGYDQPSDMLREADAALQVAKRRGPGRFELTAFAD